MELSKVNRMKSADFISCAGRTGCIIGICLPGNIKNMG